MTLIAAGCFLLATSGQKLKEPFDFEHFEGKEDPPAAYKPFGFAPRYIAPFGNFRSYQVNVDGLQQNILGDAANEPSLCVDPTNPNRIAIGWRQFDNVTSNFRQAGYAFTTDGGLTWNFPGKLENNVFRSDPVLAARYDGTFLYLSLLETFFDDIWTSPTGGASWARVAAATGGDKQWFVVDNTNSSGRGFLYQCWSTAGNNYGGRQFSRSVDGGLTWMDPINIPNRPIWGVLDVDAAGTLYLGGYSSGAFRAVRSQNARNSAVTPTFDLTTTINLGGAIDSGSLVNPGGLTGQFWLAVDRSTALPNPIYAACSVEVNASNPADVMVARSRNSISSWDAAVRVNDDPLNSGNYHWMASMAVGPSGRVDVVWNDTRNDSSHATSALYYAYSLDGGQHFSSNIRVSPSFNQSLGYPNQNKMGDYMGLVSNSVGANIAYTATFNGEEDVYFLQIPSVVVVPPTTLTIPAATFTGNAASLANIDGNYVAASSLFARSSGTILDVFLDATSPSANPKAMLFNLVGHGQYTGDVISVQFLNWSTGQYESIGSTVTAFTDQTLNVQATGNLTRFVDQSTGAIRAKLHVSHVSSFNGSAWRVFFDQAVWHVIP